jgi:hypothetical protein
MKTKLIIGLVFVLGGDLFASETATNSRPLVHNFEYITYPWNMPDGKDCPGFLVGYGEHPEVASQGFRLDIMNIVQGFEFVQTNGVTARLYRADGEVVEPTDEGKKMLKAPIAVSDASYPGEKPVPQVMTYFPWGTNALKESWVEVTMGPERYWVEIPYGFDRNPGEPLPPATRGGPPGFDPAMKSLTEHDHVMRWLTVHYDLGVIQNGWRLSLIQSNTGEAAGEVILYREDIKIGTATSWETNSPVTSLRVLDGGGKVIGSHCTDVHIQDGGMERCNTYDIDRNAEGDDERCWGQIEIGVDDRRYQVVVPSSLYKEGHGHAVN